MTFAENRGPLFGIKLSPCRSKDTPHCRGMEDQQQGSNQAE
jgi:hypothetical protein